MPSAPALMAFSQNGAGDINMLLPNAAIVSSGNPPVILSTRNLRASGAITSYGSGDVLLAASQSITVDRADIQARTGGKIDLSADTLISAGPGTSVLSTYPKYRREIVVTASLIDVQSSLELDAGSFVRLTAKSSILPVQLVRICSCCARHPK